MRFKVSTRFRLPWLVNDLVLVYEQANKSSHESTSTHEGGKEIKDFHNTRLNPKTTLNFEGFARHPTELFRAPAELLIINKSDNCSELNP